MCVLSNADVTTTRFYLVSKNNALTNARYQEQKKMEEVHVKEGE
jgi:hypothetical protein